MNRLHPLLVLLLFMLLGSINVQGQYLYNRNKDLPCINKHFNIHAHIVLDAAGNTNMDIRDLQMAVDTANVHFGPICFSFSICEMDTITNYAFAAMTFADEASALQTNHMHRNRINLFLIDNFGPICGIGGGQNITMVKACTGFTLTHELGHVFGLQHTFAGTGELVDGSNCDTAGDLICDTPADPFFFSDSIVWTRNCEFVYEGLDGNGEFYQPDVGNIMSYFGCPCGFTREQYLSMVDFYLNSPLLKW